MIFIFLAIHIMVCIILGVSLYTKRLAIKTPAFVVIVFVPVCGVLMLVAEWLVERRKRAGSREIGLDKLRIQEAKYQRIEVEQGENEGIVVPLEEAIVVNDAKTRRKLMLDILHRNPEEHIELLQRARLTEDTELTHYATTTMMEIQSSYEQVIRELEQQLEEARGEERVRILRKLRKELELYINSGLITGNILNIYRKKLGVVLEDMLQKEPENKNYYLGKIENNIEQNQMEEIEKELNEAAERWPEDEKVYQLQVRYYQATYRGEMIQKVLTEIEEKGIYLSSEGKKWFQFWKNEELHV